MTAYAPTYKLERKLSVEGQMNDKPNTVNFAKPEESPHFFTEKRIEIKPFLFKLHSGGEQNQRHQPAYGHRRQNELISILDEKSRLENSSGDQASEMSRTLLGLGLRRGHSFEKQKVDFSLSSDAYDTEQQNLILRKKVNEMKKQVEFYRAHDDTMFQDVLKAKEKTELAEKEVNHLKFQLENCRERVAQLQGEMMNYEKRIEELQRIIAHTSPKKKGDTTTEQLQQQLENYRILVKRHEDETEDIKEHYEHELFQNSLKFRKLIDELNQKFQNAKVIGQNQINELIAKLMGKDEEIAKLKGRTVKQSDKSNKKTVTLTSDHIEKSKEKEAQVVDPHAYKYMNRFIQFSQFIDQRIHKSLSKEKGMPRGRISKSAINKEQAVPRKDLTIRMPESPYDSSEKINFLKISDLLEKNKRLNTPTHVFQSTF